MEARCSHWMRFSNSPALSSLWNEITSECSSYTRSISESDGGTHWTQPTYTGWTARHCLGAAGDNDPPCQPHVGPIGTLPGYYENGLVSDGDPSLAFGPRRGPDGSFSWANGARLYYANLTSNFSSVRSETSFKGFEAIAVSRTDNVAAAAAGSQGAWLAPVIVSRQNAALFSDHEQVWADNAESSAFFGNVYICFAAFRSQEISPNSLPGPIKLARSTDGGDTWTERQLTAATNNIVGFGRQDCGVRTDSHGTVYVFWQEGIHSLVRTRSGSLALSMAVKRSSGRAPSRALRNAASSIRLAASRSTVSPARAPAHSRRSTSRTARRRAPMRPIVSSSPGATGRRPPPRIRDPMKRSS